MKNIKKILKYESLENVEKYSIDYLYGLLNKHDWETKTLYFKHMRWVHRIIYFLVIIILVAGFYELSNISDVTGFRFGLFFITLSITAAKIVDHSYKENVKSQIEYRKHLEDKNEKSAKQTI